MHTKFASVLNYISALGIESTAFDCHTNLASTKEQYGTKRDCSLFGTWFCCYLSAEQAFAIAKDTISIVLDLADDADNRLLCCKMEKDAEIIELPY